MTQQAGSPFLTHDNTLPSFVVKRTASTNLLVHTLLAARAGESWAQLCSADLCDATELAPLQANWSSLVQGGFALATVEQNAGKGRNKRVWRMHAGDLAVSFWVVMPPEKAAPLPLLGGLAVLDTLAEFGVTDAWCKWPNDIYCHDSKLCGILCEYQSVTIPSGIQDGASPSDARLERGTDDAARACGGGKSSDSPVDTVNTPVDAMRMAVDTAKTAVDAVRMPVDTVKMPAHSVVNGVILGIGVNLAATAEQLADIDIPAVSLFSLTGQHVSAADFLAVLSGKVQSRAATLRSRGFSATRAEWYEHCWHRGQNVCIRQGAGREPISGETVGVGELGQLLVRQGGQVSEVWIGDVERLRRS